MVVFLTVRCEQKRCSVESADVFREKTGGVTETRNETNAENQKIRRRKLFINNTYVLEVYCFKPDTGPNRQNHTFETDYFVYR